MISLPTVRQVPHLYRKTLRLQSAAVPKEAGALYALPALPLVCVFSVSSPFLPGNSHIPPISDTATSLSAEQLLGELRSDKRDDAAHMAPWEVLESRLNL